MLSWNNLKLRKKSKSSSKVTLNKVDGLKQAFGKLQFSIGTGWKHFKPLLYIYKPEAISFKERKGLLIRVSCKIFLYIRVCWKLFFRLSGSAASFFLYIRDCWKICLFIRVYWKIFFVHQDLLKDFWFIRVCWKFFWFIRVYWKIFVHQGLLRSFFVHQGLLKVCFSSGLLQVFFSMCKELSILQTQGTHYTSRP